MPRKSLSNKTQPKEPVSAIKQEFKCIGPCKRVYVKQRNNFPTTQSLIYAGNNQYLPWCNKCVDAFYSRYRDECGMSEEEAIKRLCSKFDIYWAKKIYLSMPSANSATSSRFRTYIMRSNLTQYAGLTYDDTIAEEQKAMDEILKERMAELEAANKEEDDEEEIDVPQELIDFWGKGKDPSSYQDLQRKYEKLTKGCTVDSPATEMLVKQACLSDYEIDQLQREGKPFEKQQSSLVNTLGSLNLKPSQIKEAEKNSGLDLMPLGVGIQRWEQTRPISEVDESWKDVDNIIKYVLTWYTGGTMEMFGEDHEYADLFRAAIDEYTVTKPGVDDDSGSDPVYDAISHYLNGGDDDAE